MPSITTIQAELGRVGFAVVVIVVLAAALAVIGSMRRRGLHSTATAAASVGFAVVMVAVLSLTLFGWEAPSAAERRVFLDPVAGARGWDSIAWRPVVDNVALFVPVGALAAAVWWRRSAAVVWLSCLALSVGIETFQYLVPTGRVANAADVVANGVGALLGVLLAVALGARSRSDRELVRHRRSRARLTSPA